VGLILEYDQRNKQLEIKGYTIPENQELTKNERIQAYLLEGIKESPLPQENRNRLQHYLQTMKHVVEPKSKQKTAVYTKYKPVAQKVKPLHVDLPDKYRIIREIHWKICQS
jgi:hypothetical protein